MWNMKEIRCTLSSHAHTGSVLHEGGIEMTIKAQEKP